jgi:hypothetical protein
MEVGMGSVTVNSTVFAFVFGGALAGMLLRVVLPRHHLSSESKEVIKLGAGLVGTMAALILGLVVASAKSSHDAQSTELTQTSANIILLDRVLAHYGPETQEVRGVLRRAVVQVLNQTWSKDRSETSRLEPASSDGEILYDKIQGLSPGDASQRSLQSQALTIAMNLGQTRWLMYEQQTTAVSKPLLIIIVFWLMIVFICWGLLAPPNGTLVATLCVSALAASGAIFLILEMYTPYQGWIQISSAPLNAALAHLGQ